MKARIQYIGISHHDAAFNHLVGSLEAIKHLLSHYHFDTSGNLINGTIDQAIVNAVEYGGGHAQVFVVKED